MAKNDISVDAIPDAAETPGPSGGSSAGPTPLDMNKLMSNHYNMPSPFLSGMPGMPAGVPVMPSNDPMQMNMQR